MSTSQKNKHGLGRGLSALLGDAETVDGLLHQQPAAPAAPETPAEAPQEEESAPVEAAPEETTPEENVLLLPLDRIRPNPQQPRLSFDRESLDALAVSIRNFGLIQPITVRRSGEFYEIISGERRFRAARIAGLSEVPAFVREAETDVRLLEMALVENIQREDLDPIEEALSYRRLIEECELTQEQLADRLGKKRVTVTNTLRLLRLPARVQHDLKIGQISVGHAKVLLSVEDPMIQESLCDRIVREDLSVRQLEERVRRLQHPALSTLPPEALPESYVRVIEQLGRYFESSISLKRAASGKGGTMTVRFSSEEQLDRFLEALENGGE